MLGPLRIHSPARHSLPPRSSTGVTTWECSAAVTSPTTRIRSDLHFDSSGCFCMCRQLVNDKPTSTMHRIHSSEFSTADYGNGEGRAMSKFQWHLKQMKRMRCSKFVMGLRLVFGMEEGEKMGENCYSWPAHRIHKRARDQHHSLNSRVDVPDQKVKWEHDWDDESYKPAYALPETSNELDPAGGSLSSRNPCGR